MKKRILFKFIIIITIIMILFPTEKVFSATSGEAGLYVASYAKKFCEEHKLVYNLGTSAPGKLNGDTYTSECVGFCKYMYMNAIGYNVSGNGQGIPVPSSNSGVNNSPADTQAGKRSDDFELIAVDDLSKALPGDIIENYHHDMIYIGTVDGKKHVLANNGKNNNRDGLANGLVTYDEYYGANPHHVRIWRLTDAAAAGMDSSTFESGGELISGVSNSSSTSMGASKVEVSDWYYNGIPDGKYSVVGSVFQLIIDNLGQIFDYLVGFCTLILRMVFVGWTTLIEKLITFTVQSITGGEPLDKISTTSMDIETGDYISIEKIIFNQISVFDVNFFNFNE